MMKSSSTNVGQFPQHSEMRVFRSYRLVCSDDSVSLRPWILIWWKGLCSSSPCLEVQELEKYGKSDYQWKLNQKIRWVPQPSLVVICSPVLFIGEVHFLYSSFCYPHTCRSPSYYSSYSLPNSKLCLAFLTLALHVSTVSLYSSQHTYHWFHCPYISFYMLFWPGGPYTAIMAFCHPCLMSYTWELRLFLTEVIS